MTVVWETEVTSIGKEVEQLIQEKTLILFDESVPDELKDISILHAGKKINDEIRPGDTLWMNEEKFEIYFVGDRVNQSFQELGHITIKFNGSQKDMPGSICVEEKAIPSLKVGTLIQVTR